MPPTTRTHAVAQYVVYSGDSEHGRGMWWILDRQETLLGYVRVLPTGPQTLFTERGGTKYAVVFDPDSVRVSGRRLGV